MLRFLIILVSVFALLFVVFWVAKLIQSRPKTLGIRDGKLLPCPASPNCVSTTATDDLHAIEPIRFTGTVEDAYKVVLEFVQQQETVRVYEERPQDGYLRVEDITPLMRFVDDIEFLVHDGVIHFRSASRFGYGDMGTNRKRMDAWKAALATRL